MKTRYGTSPWISAFPESRRPAFDRLRGDLAADVVIVGGGLTGCALALALAHAGARPVVLEADRIGQGSAGRSAGLLLPEPGPAFLEVQRAHGLRAARTVFESWRRAAIDAAATLRRAGIRCQLSPVENLLTAAPGSERALGKDFEARDAAGFDSTSLTPKQARSIAGLDAQVAMRLRGGFVLDPYRACVGLATKAAGRKARLFERTRVRKVRAMARHVEIAVEGGLVRAGTVVIATGIATAEFAPLRRHFKPRDRYVVLTEPLPSAMRRHLFPEKLTLHDTRVPRHSLRWTSDHRLVVAGADQDAVPAARRDAVRVQRTGQLMYELLTMYPVISGLQPEFGWEVAYGSTADGLPYIGPHRNYPRHLFALGGDDSLTGAFLSARLLARRILDEPQKGDEVFGWTR
jgi:glycine/D-amino acid oxidase-like deaminating enzyme